MALKGLFRILFLWFFLAPFITFSQNALLKNYSTKNGLPSNKVFSMIEDSKGNIWFATDKGVTVFNGKNFKTFSKKDGLPDNTVLGIFEDSKGRVWFRTLQSRLAYSLNNKIYTFKGNSKLVDVVDNRIVNSFYVDQSSNIWIGTVIGGGLITVTSSQQFSKASPDSTNDFSYYIKKFEDADLIWGSNNLFPPNNKLKVLTSKKPFVISLSQEGGYSKTFAHLLHNGEYLFSKNNEIVRFNDSIVISRTFVEKSIEYLFEDGEGKLWVAMYGGGVICYPSSNLNTRNLIKYLGDQTVTCIEEDSKGNIWFSTIESGVFYLPQNLYLSYSSPQVFSSPKQQIKSSDNKNVKEIPKFPDRVPPNFKPVKVHGDTIPPTIFISGIKILEKDTTVLNEYVLSYDQNFIKINYVGFSNKSAEQIQYKYKMDGVDRNWVFTNNTNAQYTTLPPGKYTFTVSAMNNEGVWSTTEAKMLFIIHPPYWQTWWFRILIVLIFSAIVFFIFFLRLKQLREKEAEKTELNKKISGIELQALRAQMNPHFTFNTMSSIQHFITQNNNEEALKYLSKFAKLMRSIMENSKRQVIPIKEEINALRLYLELESLRFENKFEYEIDIDKDIDPQYDEIPSMLIQPYIENAIWHGLMPKKAPGKITIQLKSQDKLLVCSIEDNGIGRKKSMEIKTKNQSAHLSQGMKITKERLEIMNSLNNSNLSVNVIDLYDENKNATGTKIEIFIPKN